MLVMAGESGALRMIPALVMGAFSAKTLNLIIKIRKNILKKYFINQRLKG